MRLPEKPHRLLITFLFIFYFLIGWHIYADYGIAFDEIGTRGIGLASAKYLIQTFRPAILKSYPAADNVSDLSTFPDRDYGPAFELVLIGAEKIVLGDHRDPYDIYMFRHLCIFISFFIGVVFFYKLVKQRFQSWKIGLLGAAFLTASPRIFADAFYNSKDIPCLSAFIASAYFLSGYLEKKNLSRAALLGVATGFTISVRVLGIMVPAIAGLFIFAEIVSGIIPKPERKTTVASFAAYCVFTVIVSLAFWPYLWTSPISHFRETFANMSRFLRFDNYVLYNGSYTRSTALPWHYVPVWISVTTPILYLTLFVVGVILIIYRIVRRPAFRDMSGGERFDLLALVMCVTPLIAVIVLHSVLYDAWRQLFFVYGFFLLIALSAFQRVLAYARLRAALIGLTVLSLSFTLAFMVRYHPYENVYFNILAGKDAGRKYEMDYWGLSYRQALAFIAEQDKRPVIRIQANNESCYANKFTLPLADRDRIVFVDSAPDYYVTEFRHFLDKPIPVYGSDEEVFAIRVDGVKIAAVYKGSGHGLTSPFGGRKTKNET